MNITKKRIAQFIDALDEQGGSSGNGRLREVLDWDEESYWKVQGHLIETGQIIAGRGRGGSVRFTDAHSTELDIEPARLASPQEPVNSINQERALYAPLKNAIEGKWIKRFALDDVMVEETHSRGSRDTGGTFTRPDITAAGIRRYVYLPKRLEIVTFEVKPADSDEVARVYRSDAVRRSNLMPPTIPI